MALALVTAAPLFSGPPATAAAPGQRPKPLPPWVLICKKLKRMPEHRHMRCPVQRPPPPVRPFRSGDTTRVPTVTELNIPTGTSGPVGITSGPDDALWFAENYADQIGRVTTDGDFTEYPLDDPNAFPWGITSGSDGRLWVAEQLGNAAASVTTSGIIIEYNMPTVLAGPFDITSGPDGNVWLTEDYVDQIAKVTL
ncbi:hypothetical protein DI270_026900 [Microbispora triticiradicis]|uniref:Virginiamycin B lyase n=1 Tax=Microbispora triticiradicis TaxID=2200763 RepID=A0ABX9LDT4_9ACTN|nr:hypothetical protein [Microbispora triticiradicis]RGA01945.1 hypothetical protein DI270_026900 [Microbispora triticiradicis]GLW24705.1 hypothetical protein Mame01_47470 [Microbispora amethystogenes]